MTLKIPSDLQSSLFPEAVRLINSFFTLLTHDLSF